MARDTQSIVKMSRREGYALHPKAHKALVKRSAVPGQQGRNQRGKTSQYSLQLREKQKVKRRLKPKPSLYRAGVYAPGILRLRVVVPIGCLPQLCLIPDLQLFFAL